MKKIRVIKGGSKDLSPPAFTGTTVRERIVAKRAILKRWLENGVPEEKLSSLPHSLRAARVWEDPELNLQKIGSPNEFTTKNALWGHDVAEIARLLTALKSYRIQTTKKKLPTKSVAPQRTLTKDFEERLQVVAAQWHEAREDLLLEKSRADSAEARVATLLEEGRQKDAEIAELRGQLAMRKGFQIVK